VKLVPIAPEPPPLASEAPARAIVHISEGVEVQSAAFEPPWVAGARRVMQNFLLRFDGTTLRGYRSDLAMLAEHLGLTPPGERTADQAAAAAGRAIVELFRGGHGVANERAAEWKAAMKRVGLKERTINRRLATLRSMFKVARELEVIDWTLDVRGFTVEATSDREGPSGERIAKIVATLENESTPEAIRDVAIVRLLSIGLRRGEVSSRDLAHVKFDRSALTIRGKKRTQDENVTLPAGELEAIRRWLDVRGREPGPLFTRLHSGVRMSGYDIWNMTRSRGRQVFGDDEKLAPIRPHGLRHNAATRGLDLTQGNVAGVGSLLRQRDLQVVQAYDDKRRDRGGAVAELLSEDLSRQVAALRKEKA
jgi:integrase/recombinase XerC